MVRLSMILLVIVSVWTLIKKRTSLLISKRKIVEVAKKLMTSYSLNKFKLPSTTRMRRNQQVKVNQLPPQQSKEHHKQFRLLIMLLSSNWMMLMIIELNHFQ